MAGTQFKKLKKKIKEKIEEPYLSRPRGRLQLFREKHSVKRASTLPLIIIGHRHKYFVVFSPLLLRSKRRGVSLDFDEFQVRGFLCAPVPPFSPFNVLFVERSLFTEANSVDTSKEYLVGMTFNTQPTLYSTYS